VLPGAVRPPRSLAPRSSASRTRRPESRTISVERSRSRRPLPANRTGHERGPHPGPGRSAGLPSRGPPHRRGGCPSRDGRLGRPSAKGRRPKAPAHHRGLSPKRCSLASRGRRSSPETGSGSSWTRSRTTRPGRRPSTAIPPRRPGGLAPTRRQGSPRLVAPRPGFPSREGPVAAVLPLRPRDRGERYGVAETGSPDPEPSSRRSKLSRLRMPMSRRSAGRAPARATMELVGSPGTTTVVTVTPWRRAGCTKLASRASSSGVGSGQARPSPAS
jgi:hypothetical protein